MRSRCSVILGEVNKVKKQDYVAPKLTVVGTATDVTGQSGKITGSHDTYVSGLQPGTYYQYDS